MIQTPIQYCDCCGLAVDTWAGEDCPRCSYPISPPKEKRFLALAIRDLQRVAFHGGGNITVVGLILRYQTRLNSLDQFNVAPVPARLPVVPPSRVAPAQSSVPPVEKSSEIVPLPSPYEPDVSLPYIPYARVVPPVAPVEKPPEVVPPLLSAKPVEKSPERAVPRPPVAPVVRPAGVAPARQPGPAVPVKPPAPAAPVRQSASIREVVFSWGAFFVDHAITVIGLLGAFILLLAALSFVYINTVVQSGKPLESFLVVFGAHAFFGVLGIITYRFPGFRLIARLYVVIYALLLPLAGFTGYSLILGHLITLPVPVLITIAAAYATIVYGLLAVYLGSIPFGYLGVVALAVVDLTIAKVFGLDYQWWPSTLMILALPALVTVARSSGGTIGERVFAGRLSVLHDPIRMLMFLLVGVCALGILLTASYSFILDSFGGPVREIRFSILSMTLLLLLWTGLYMWLIRRTKQVLVLVGLSLASVLAFCYAFNFEHIGYALALTGAALLYHGLNRFAGRLLQPFGKLCLRLNQLALVLVALVPLISAPLLPLQLLPTVYQPSALRSFPFYVQTTWEIVGTLLAVGASLLLTLSVAFNRAGLQRTSGTQRNAWPWLLLLSGGLLNWEYGEVVLALHAIPVWWFLGLTLALVVGAVVVRQRFGSDWANLLDVLTLAEALLTLSLNLDQPDSLWSLLLLFAVLSYGVLLSQRRQKMLILPLVFAWLALPLLVFTLRLQVVLLLGMVLPFAAVAVRRLIPANLVPIGSASSTNWRVTIGWEWPLLTIALLSGIIVSGFDLISSGSTVHNWLHVPFPVALELATFSLAWYVSAVLARVKWWLLPVIGFAIAASLLPFNPFWVLFGVTIVSAALALGIRRFAGRDWAWPFSIVTLLAAVMTGVAGHTPYLLLATTWVLLAFAVLFYIMGVVEDWTPWLWIMPVFATWSLIDSAALLGDLFRPPTLVLICAAAGVAIGLFNLFARRRNSFIRYVLPFYATAFVAAVLTGVYGTLGGVSGVNNPFPGAVPVALLVYAAIAYGVLLFERRPLWLGLVAGFAIWGTLLATQTASYAVLGIKMMPAYDVLAIGMVVGIAGLLLSRLVKLPTLNTVVSVSGYDLVKFSWGWPWYVTALVAAVVTGVFASLPVAAWALLIFAVLFYIIGVVEDQVSWLWLVPALVTWSRIDALWGNDLYGLFAVSLLSVALGVGVGVLKRFVPVFSGSARENRRLRYALPFYVTALASAMLTGIDGMIFGINQPFVGAIPAVLLVYAAVAYGVLLFERRPWWLGLVAGFAIWGTVLALQTTIYYVVGIGVVAGIVGLLLGRVRKQTPSSTATPPFMQSLVKLTWGWPWYATALVAAIITGLWSSLPLVQPVPGFIAYGLLGFAVLFYIIGVVEDFAPCLWLAPVFANWSLIDSAMGNDLVRLITVALVCAAVGLTTGVLNRIMPSFFASAQRNRRLRYALPFYITALASAVLTGIDVTFSNIHPPFDGAFPAVLLVYAAVAYGVLLFERRPGWLWLVAGFAIWGMLLVLLASPMIYYVVGIGIGAGLVGLLIGLIARRSEVNVTTPTYMQTLAPFTWSWPWYATALVAAIITGLWSSLPLVQPVPGFIAYGLLGFAVLFYIIGVVEDQVSWLWAAPALATWSLIDSVLQPDFSRLPTVALTCAVVGVAMSSLTRFVPRFRDSALGNRLPRYTLPFYAVALVASVLTGIEGMHFGLNQPFYGVALVPGTVPVALLLYAVVAYGVLLFERRPGWLWLVAGFAIWGMLLVLLASPMIYYVVGIGIGAGLVGLLIGLIARRSEVNVTTPTYMQTLAPFTWSWPWYLTTLVAAAVTSVWSSFPFDQPAAGFVMYSLFTFAALTVLMMLVERLPEALVFPLVLAAVAIGQTQWGVWQLMVAYSLLCVLIFASQFIWKLIPPAMNWLPATLLHRIFGLGGQALVVLTIILLGGLSADSGSLAHVGAGTLFVLTLLLCWYGRLQRTVTLQRWCYYSAGLLLSLVVPWELLAFKQTNLDLLTLAPASYLVVIGPFLIREEALPQHHRIGQAVSMLGAALLLLPTLWLSFSSGDGNVLYTLILLGESLVLLVLGLGLRVRILILCGAGLIVVGALHALFLSTPSIPLALAGLGVILLLVATGLTLARHRLRGAWARWQ